MTSNEMICEIQVLNEALAEADELVEGLQEQINYLKERNKLLENRLKSYGIGFDDIDRYLLSAEKL